MLKPYEPNGLERGMAIGERVGQMLQRDGIYLKMGSLTTGSGFAYGAGYRDRSLFRSRGAFDAWAGGSLKKYWAVKCAEPNIRSTGATPSPSRAMPAAMTIPPRSSSGLVRIPIDWTAATTS